MPFNSNTADAIFDARGVTRAQVAQAANISLTRFEEILAGERSPSPRQVERLSDKLAVPPYAFFMDAFDVRQRESLLDFRRSNPRPAKVGFNASFFEHFFRLREFAAKFLGDVETEVISTDTDENPEQLAQAYRALLRLNDFQFEHKQGAARFYGELRRRVEALGIFVMQGSLRDASVRGFAIAEDVNTPLIVVNTYVQNHQSRAFTLAHELGHIALGATGISNSLWPRNEVETFCNKFAINLLAPRGQFNEVARKRITVRPRTFEEALDHAKYISKRFHLSISATLLRMTELQYADRSHYNLWAKQQRLNPKESLDAQNEIRRSKGPPESGRAILARLGLSFSVRLKDALSINAVSPIAVFQKTGLSRKSIESLMAVTPSQIERLAQEGGD